MENSRGDRMESLREGPGVTRNETSEYKDFVFQTTYYSDSVARFSASKKRTHFPAVLAAGVAYVMAQFIFSGATCPSAWLRVAGVLVCLLMYYRRVRVRRQTVLIFYGVGIQLETEFLVGRSSTFIKKSKILSAVIYDKMTYMELSPCIGLVVKDKRSLVVPFSDFKIPTEKNILIYNAFKMI
ncbi:PIG-H protein [Cryptosporidium canis]|uniref:PIG-H protein n=1 Tax=Cryptosporidium canis TaxID=195482 RepID=A0A9D5HUV9_9CRYT|nr:PIG-H protein [Cryptosporidium canis]